MTITNINVYRPCPASRFNVEIQRGAGFYTLIATDLPLTRAEEIAQDRKQIIESNGGIVSLIIDTRR